MANKQSKNNSDKYTKLKKEHDELIKGIKHVFDRYFEDGSEYDPNYSPTDALDDIYAWIN